MLLNSRHPITMLTLSACLPAVTVLAQSVDASDVNPHPAVASERVAGSTYDAGLDRQTHIEKRMLERNRKRYILPSMLDGDPWKKHPPIWSVRDDSHKPHPYAQPSQPAPGEGRFPGGPTGQWGYPYYYTPTSPDTAYGPVPVATLSGQENLMPDEGVAVPGVDETTPYYVEQEPDDAKTGEAPIPGQLPSYAPSVVENLPGVCETDATGSSHHAWQVPPLSFGLLPPVGPRAALPGQLPGDPYLYHFGPGFYRHQEAGHYRFPYYSYRRPWYFPGHPSYNRDTNVPW